jgi:hypothetical protein
MHAVQEEMAAINAKAAQLEKLIKHTVTRVLIKHQLYYKYEGSKTIDTNG